MVASLSPFRLSTAVLNRQSLPPLCGKSYPQNWRSIYSKRGRVIAANNSKKEDDDVSGGDPSVPSWAKPGSDELPPWARQQAQGSSSSFEVPFYVYLLASAVTAIAAVGSIFEYANQKPVFGVLNSDSVFYAPLLGFFVFTGIPSSAFLWFKSVQAANKEAEEQDRQDGYL
ncbi:P-loop containing nucleoside triphosphatehydrolases superfamily protein [Striga asiatica]|uniref:P-loop containing nucleoside triphosphatehydrolases superfamily protein n=1 Tax=Striga asiatica TaxID=4170 RepID=A0A5A7P9W1_STRAF|nr:P-loop containing nucleoside triphosphatehydrolases superfamily protein [Striga asiatica]